MATARIMASRSSACTTGSRRLASSASTAAMREREQQIPKFKRPETTGPNNARRRDPSLFKSLGARESSAPSANPTSPSPPPPPPSQAPQTVQAAPAPLIDKAHESFANLFRNSKLASITYPTPPPSSLKPQKAGAFTASSSPFTSISLSGYQMLPTNEKPVLPPHVITTSPQLKLKGEWGLKRSLPRDLKARHVIVTRLDHHAVGSRGTYRTASREVGDLMRWRWLFGYNETVPDLQREAFAVQKAVLEASSRKAEPGVPEKVVSGPPNPVPVSLDTLDSKSYLSLLRRARLLRAEFLNGTSSRSMKTGKVHWDRFLNLDTNPAFTVSTTSSFPGFETVKSYRSVHPAFYLVSSIPRSAPQDRASHLYASLAPSSSTTGTAFRSYNANAAENGLSELTEVVFGNANIPSTASSLHPAVGATAIEGPRSHLTPDLHDLPTLSPLPTPNSPPLPLLKTRVMMRYLNAVHNGHAVGILGFVGFVADKDAEEFFELSFGGGSSSSSNAMDRVPMAAHILHAGFEADGTPIVSLSLNRQTSEDKGPPKNRLSTGARLLAKNRPSKSPGLGGGKGMNYAGKRFGMSSSSMRTNLLASALDEGAGGHDGKLNVPGGMGPRGRPFQRSDGSDGGRASPLASGSGTSADILRLFEKRAPPGPGGSAAAAEPGQVRSRLK
ncbi:hypothetical protein HDU67_007301 [Dinochytrium kinnereticum]|nr:hypothetical protein HDU67_007301 [Dinochytrium kinnereticum]